MQEGKYVVFNMEEFANWIKDGGALPLKEIEDAVVIRRQDIFAAPALYSYGHSISIAAKMTSDDLVKRSLQDLADFFVGQADLAAEEGYKVPD